jgi:hypothetical protein
MGVAVRPVPFVAGMRIWRGVAAPPGSAASNQAVVVKFMLGCVVVNRLGRKSWKKVLDQEVVDRHDLFSPCRASLVRRSPGMCWSPTGRKDFMVGPNWKGTPSPARVNHGCATLVAYRSHPLPDRERDKEVLSRAIRNCSPPLRALPWRPDRQSRVSSEHHLMWVRKDLV